MQKPTGRSIIQKKIFLLIIGRYVSYEAFKNPRYKKLWPWIVAKTIGEKQVDVKVGFLKAGFYCNQVSYIKFCSESGHGVRSCDLPILWNCEGFQGSSDMLHGIFSHFVGFYWVDPNMGCKSDAIRVYCNITDVEIATCVTPSADMVCNNCMVIRFLVDHWMRPGGLYLVNEHTGRCRWKIWKKHHVLGSNSQKWYPVPD